MQTWTTIPDKTVWGDGPWVGECDKAQWVDPVTGLVCLAVRNLRDGHWCGYVGVAPGHRLHGVQVRAAGLSGEVNYSDFCQEDDRPIGQRVCHLPEPGQPDDVWWFGFDLGHAWDYQPGRVARDRAQGGVLAELHAGVDGVTLPDEQDPFRPTYKPLGYVQAECTTLAAQLPAG